ncbi:MAG: hypothetical protein FJW64_08965 [Actinobacteria bacterium]|nr:hypothetical protein [Actinomycetota bacterium]
MSAVVLISVLSLTGCDGGRDGSLSSLPSLEEAKEEVLTTQREIAGFVPPGSVAGVEQDQTGPLLSCRKPDTYSWYGRLTITYRGELDIQAILADVYNAFSQKDGYSARERPFLDGAPRIQIRGAGGETYFVGENPDRTALEVSSYSRCFVLPEGAWPGDTL